MRHTATIFVICLLGGLGWAQSESQPFVGFRNDGTGVFPADCEPVTEWNEAEFRTEKRKDDRGRMRDTDVYVRDDRKNIVWKASLPTYCNGGMIVTGGKLVFLGDPGGVGYAGKVEPDFLGVPIYCLDPATGKLLWKADLHHADLVDADVRDKLRDALKAEREFGYKVMGAHLRWHKACWQRSKKPAPPKEEHEAMYRKAAAEYRQYVPAVPATLAEQRASKEWKASGYVQTMFWKIRKKHIPQAEQRLKLLRKYGYDYNDFFGQTSFIGSAMGTPVSDGEHIYVNTFYGDAFCLDLDGEIVWKKWYGYGLDRGGGITSPILVDDLLILRGKTVKGKSDKPGVPCWMAVRKDNGQIVWQTPRKGGKSYTDATPSLHRLPIAGDESNRLAVLWCPTGQVLRARDGKVLATELGCQGNARPWAADGDVLVINNGSSDGGAGKAQTFPKGTVAFRLKAPSAEKVEAEMLWSLQGRNKGLSRLVARDGVVYGFERKGRAVQAVDLISGKTLGRASAPRDASEPHHYSVIAGDYLFGLDHDGRCMVVQIGEKLTFEGINRLGTRAYAKYDFFNEGSQLFVSGNRIFIRSNTDVYCIGDPQAQTRLSPAHR
jgi:outer membrane protein assembly factor BamB